MLQKFLFERKWQIKNNLRDCLIETALAEETRLEAKLLNDTEIELYKVSDPLYNGIVWCNWKLSFAQRNFELKKSAYDKEVETARAQAELAFQLQTAKVMIVTEILAPVVESDCDWDGGEFDGDAGDDQYDGDGDGSSIWQQIRI